LRRYVEADLEKLAAEGVRIRVIGRREGLSEELLAIVERAETRTRENSDFHLTIAFNYGGRDELVRAARRAAEALNGDLSGLDEAGFASFLDTTGLPDPDLVIRTSGERRVSNFLLWQAAYAEFVFVDTLWPDFDEAAFAEAISVYAGRERRFGGLAHG
jgi:undecaprenyl diphosphate synthase